MFVSLWNKSNCSFLEGASDPEELIDQCAAYGYGCMALTDRDGVYGAVRALAAGEESGVRPLVGAEVRVAGVGPVVLLVEDAIGYGNLCGLLTALWAAKTMAKPGRRTRDAGAVSVRRLAMAAPGLVLLLPRVPAAALGDDEQLLMTAFAGRLYALLTRHANPQDGRVGMLLRRWAARWQVPVVAGVEVLYHERGRRPLQDVLRCIATGCSLGKAGSVLTANDRQALPSPTEVVRLFADVPGAVALTAEVAARCQFSLRELDYRYPAEGEVARLRELVAAGCQQRYPDGTPPAVEAQLAHEIELVDELGYCGYFLTMYEIVDWCRQQGILCQGRGSAANSAVCYALGITAVDPVRMELLFERFLSRERDEPPDIDLDIEHDRRELVIQHVYQEYGREHAALAGVVSCFRGRSAVREVGKVFELPGDRVARLAALVGRGKPTAELLKESGFDDESPYVQAYLARLHEIIDVPRHLSTHPGGFVLGRLPLQTLSPVQPAAMPGRTILQWDKNDLETMKIFKVDLLGLGALSHLRRCFDMLEVRDGKRPQMKDLPLDDPETFAMLARGDTTGVFQVESRAQMATLPRLKPKVWYDLVIQISIIRPGPIVGGMVHPFLRRRRGEEPVTYPHPLLEPVLKKTLGVPIFQEQVMKIAMIAADYSPGEADQLRRDMAAWRRHGRLEGHRTRLLSRMRQKGISEAFAEQVFQQISGFGEYGFPESHAASFALIAWAASWLRCHEPTIFLCALLNSQPMGFYSPATLIEDGRRRGVKILPIDVQTSTWSCQRAQRAVGSGEAAAWGGGENGEAIRMGLRYVKGLSLGDAERLLRAREEGRFASVAELRQRTGFGNGVMRTLARAGALDSLEGNRRQSNWATWQESMPHGGLALEVADAPANLPAMSPLEQTCADYRYSGHSTNGHPLAEVRTQLEKAALPDSRAVRTAPDGSRLRYVGIVICRQQPGTAKGINFLTLEDEFGFVNVIIKPAVKERYRIVLTTSTLLGITGTLQHREGVAHLVAQQLWRPVLRDIVPTVPSRDWH